MSTKKIQTQFKRIETKYLVRQDTLAFIQEDFKHYLVPDDYPTSTITNIYFDSLDYKMIRDSIERKNGRKKIRMRFYDNHPNLDSQAFLEMKQKDEMGVGHKFRLTASARSILDFVENGVRNSEIADNPLADELDKLRLRHGRILPMMYIYYDRFSMKGIEDPNIRVTVDKNIIFRSEEVNLESGKYGEPLIDENLAIMEIKIANDCPEWLEGLLVKYNLINQSFSKYGNAYSKSQISKGMLTEEVIKRV